jgi:DNA-binding response OmpR family regulator
MGSIMKPTVLIADGDVDLCDLYRQFLCERGYAVETASDGLDCLAKLRRLRPAAIVLDWQLHWGGGDGVLSLLREESALSAIPVVLTATAGYPMDATDNMEPPIVSFLPKPFALTTLLETVRAALTQEHRIEPFNRRWASYSELYFG